LFQYYVEVLMIYMFICLFPGGALQGFSSVKFEVIQYDFCCSSSLCWVFR